MSKRRNLEAHVSVLGDLRDVLESMKNLALVEIGKLTRTQAARRRLLEELMGVASACAPYFPATLQGPAARLYLLVGSERSFCGGFNDEIVAAWADVRRRDPQATAIVMGSVLSEKIEPGSEIVARVAGPAIAEDVDRCLIDVLQHIAVEEKRHAAVTALAAIAHGGERLENLAILPFEPEQAPRRELVPERNLTRQELVAEFTDQYVDAALHSVVATSLVGENRARLSTMMVAIDNLDRNVARLRRRIHHERQEEITQEVEAILLSAEAFR